MRICFAAAAVLIMGGPLLAENAVLPGKLTPEAPTVTCLGVRWTVAGDENRNASVSVVYRAKGDAEWREAMPLFRVDHRAIAYGRKVPDMFAGSVFDLKPGAEHQLRLKMSDPDGGGDERTVTMRTRPVPMAPAGAEVVKVAPSQLRAAAAGASPGQIILVSPGTFSGGLNLSGKKGAADRPIVIRAAETGKVILDGGGGRDVVDLRGAEHVYLEGLVLRNGRNAVNAQSAKGLVVRRCRIEKCRQGFNNADKNRPGSDFYISDNVIVGPYKWPYMAIKSEEGVQVCGTGHVVCYNRIYGWSDGISVTDQRGDPYPVAAIDYYNNDISDCTDDAIEMDTSQHNTRAFRNRITDCHAGITNQPVYGGPVYIFRNVLYNLAASPLKLHNETSGLVVMHNTVVRNGVTGKGGRAAFLHYTSTPVRNARFRNNLFLCNGSRSIESWGDFIGCDLDYNGYNKGEVAFTKDGAKFKGPGIKEFSEKTGFEKHAKTVDIAVFAAGIKYPVTEESHKPPDLRLREGSTAADSGEVLPNISEGFAGKAPDLGAYELGARAPHYGPRPDGMDEMSEYERRRAELAATAAKAREVGAVTAGAPKPETAKTPDGVTADQAVRAAKRSEELRKAIIDGAAEGRRARAYVDIAGKPTRARVIAADGTGLTVLAQGLEVKMEWSAVPPKRFYGIARKYSRDHQALWDYCVGFGLSEEAAYEARRK